MKHIVTLLTFIYEAIVLALTEMHPNRFIRTSIVLLFIFIQNAHAQTSTDPNTYVLPSPAAMTFRKFGDYPVDYSTGLAKISVPIYTIQLRDYSFPISVDFHASGRTTAQNFSPLGMNWALMANGLISLEVRGRRDGTTNSHLEKSPTDLLPITSHYDDVTSIDPENTNAALIKDTEYDIYTLSINGISAKFIIRNNNVEYITYCPYKIEPNAGGAFKVTDEKGIVYVFGSDGSGNGIGEGDQSGGGGDSWYIASITMPSGSAIKFKYNSMYLPPQGWLGKNRTGIDQLAIKDYPHYNDQSSTGKSVFDAYYPPTSVPTHQNPTNGDTYSLAYLKQIDFDNGTIAFSYDSSATNFLLRRIKVTSSQSTVVKNAEFFYYQVPGTNVTLFNNNSMTIQQISFEDGSNNLVEKYGFEYYPGVTGEDMYSFLRSKDWWGYCNGTTGSAYHYPFSTFTIALDQQPGGAPPNSNYNAGGSESVKTPNFAAKLPGMIKAIHYPTGGTSVFTYEPNVFQSQVNGPPTMEGPGLRIRQILSYDGLGHKTGKYYEYPVGYILRQPTTNDYFTTNYSILINHFPNSTSYTADFIGSFRQVTLSSDPMPEAQVSLRYPVYYSQVTEYDIAEDGGKNGRTIYYYSLPSANSNSNSCSPPGNGSFFGDGSFYPRVFSFSEWSQPRYEGKEVQRYDASTNTYKPVTRTMMGYTKLKEVNIPQTYIYKYIHFLVESNNFPLTTDYYQYKAVMDPNYNWTVYSLLDKTISCAIMKPSGESTSTFDNNGTELQDTVHYYYDNLTHLNPTRTQRTTSDGKTITHYMIYPPDYPAGTAFIDGLMTRHMWTPVIEDVGVQKVLGVDKVVSGSVTSYQGSAPYQVAKLELAAPLDIASFKFSNRPVNTLPTSGTATAFVQDSRYVQKVTFNNYDSKNNPLTITPTDNTPVSYIWGYNQVYPIAHVKNAVNSSIFYTGFEETEGNSTTGDAWAGLYSRTGGYSRALTGLQNGSYLLSYWQKSGTVWIYQSSTVTVSTGAYTISLAGQVDEVRFYPSNAQMVTYTYAPLVGMTSQSDIKHLPTFYEYDAAQRLLHVRDKDKNVVKKYEYSILNPPYYSTQRIATVTKNDCDPLVYLGSAVNDTIPEYMFSSNVSQADANAMRDTYLSQTQQAYANKNGFCYNYKNVEMTKRFDKACTSGLYGTAYYYTVPAAKYTALSQAAADQKALDEINANGQNTANTDPSMSCLTYAQVYKSAAISQVFPKTCPPGFSYPPLTVSVPYAQFISANSQTEADNLASAYMYHYADSVLSTKTCQPQSLVSVRVYNNTHYDMSISFTPVGGGSTFSYTSTALNLNGSFQVADGITYYVSIYALGSPTGTFHFTYGTDPTVKTGTGASWNNVTPGQINVY